MIVLIALFAVVTSRAFAVGASYDLSRDFSPTNNPNGVWTFGAKASFDGPLSVFTVRGVNPFQYWQLVPSQEPTIYLNGSSNTFTSGSLTLPAGTVWLYSGFNSSSNQYGVIRFTVPNGASGEYLIETDVGPVYDGGPQGDTDFHVLRNSQELFGRFLAPPDRTGYTNTLSLAAGDTIEFLVGRGQDGNNFGSGLKIRANLRHNPAPPVGYDLSRDFSPTQNPSGVWSFGAKPSLSGTFSLFGVRGLNPFQYWQLVPSQEPTIYRNGTSNTITLAGGQGVFPPGTVFFYSGTDGAPNGFGVVRFTAPAAGDYVLRTDVAPVYDGNSQGDTDFHVVINGAETFGRFLAPADRTSYSNVVTLAAGDTLDFMVGRGQDNSGTASGLKISATIIPTAVHPPPPPPSDFQLSRDFSPTSNPSGVWAYGAMPAISGPFSLFAIRGLNPFEYWQLVPSQEPTIYHNGTASTISIAGGQGVFPPGVVFFYSGTDGAPNGFGAIRFTSPFASNFVVHVEVAPVYDGSLQGDTDFHVARKGMEIFGQFLAPADRASYSNVLSLAAGDAVDFLVGRGRDNSGVASGLKISVTITPTEMAPPKPPATLVLNGSFELGIDPGVSTDVPGPNSTAITAWTVENASVDYIGTRWTAGDGVRCLDLSGTDAATISQVISGLTPGQAYRLSFLMAANPEVGQFTARLRASIGGASQEFSFVQSGFSTANLGWMEESMAFTATAASHKLAFTSLNPGWAGAALDKISIEAIEPPPPTSLVANGSFELGIDPGVSTDVPGPNSTTITGWTVENASVDYIGTRWTAGDGVRCLDLSGTDAATISQIISGLTPGQAYRLSFLMAANPEVGQFTARLRASIGDGLQEFAFVQSGFSTGNLGWTENTMEFTASASSHKLSFTSLNPGWAGAALDKIAIAAVTNTPPPPPPGLVANWSFEVGADPGISTDISAPNATAITGWTVEAGSVDYIGTRWTAGDGVRCLDLSGTDAGTISQMISGLTPGQHYRLSFLMAANPEVGRITARLRASIGAASQEFSFIQSGFSTANLGWTEMSLVFTATSSSHKLSFISMNPGWAGAALDRIAITVSDTPPPPANHAPVAKAIVGPLFELWDDESIRLVLAGNGVDAELTFDGSMSSDADGDTLEYVWTEEGQATPFAAGALATNSFGLGTHTLVLVVDDGQATDADAVEVEVISLSEAVDELILFVTELELTRKEKRQLLATLNRVWDSFEDGHLRPGIKQLGAFQQKVRAHLLKVKPAAGRKLIAAADQLIDAAAAAMDDDGKPKHPRDDKK